MSDVLNHRAMSGQTLFHNVCSNFGLGATRDTVEAAMKLGFEINTRDGDGRTPLGLFIDHSGHTRTSRDSIDWVIIEQEVVCFLLQNGADPSAWAEEYPLFLTPYDTGYLHGRTEDFGSYRGDLWDSCLSLCGCDIQNFRLRGPRRKAKYSSTYSRSRFELLWSGREHLCPYWDDQAWPSLEDWASEFNRESRGDCCHMSSEELDEYYQYMTYVERKDPDSDSDEEGHSLSSDEWGDEDEEEYESEGEEEQEGSDEESDGGARL